MTSASREEAACLSRGRRATAGQRMSSLIGKAQEEDDTFWNHETWMDQGGNISDDGSYDVNDEAEENKVDKFDSDFDDSESDEEEGIVEVVKETLSKSRSSYVEPKGKKRPRNAPNGKAVGTGVNARLVLKHPSAELIQPKPLRQRAPPIPKLTQTSVRSRRLSASKQATPTSTQPLKPPRRLSANKQVTPTSTQASKPHPAKKTKHKRRFTQEELLLETFDTQAENERWILKRKRSQMEEAYKNSSQTLSKNVAAMKSHSKKGHFNTITFTEMDYVPEILRDAKVTIPKEKETCVITGKRAKYRDPKTRFAYSDLDAFRELRRRLDNGIAVDQRNVDNVNLQLSPNPYLILPIPEPVKSFTIPGKKCKVSGETRSNSNGNGKILPDNKLYVKTEIEEQNGTNGNNSTQPVRLNSSQSITVRSS